MPDKILPTQLGRSQNLINPINIEKIESRSRPEGFYNAIILDAFSIILAFFAGYAYFKFLEGSWPLFAPICAFLLFAAALALEALLGPSGWRRFSILIVEIIALFVPFYALDWRMIAASAVIALIFLFIGYLQSRGELEHGTTIRFFRSTHGSVAKSVTAGLLIAIVLYLPAAIAGRIFMSEPEFNIFFNWAAGLAADFYPMISFKGSFSNFAQSVAKEELAGTTAFTELTGGEQSAAISAATSQVEENLSKSLGVTVTATSSTSDVAYNAIVNMFQAWSARFSVWFTVGWAIALFLVLRSVGVIFVWIGQFLTMIIYELLLATGVIRIVEEPQTKEVIEF